MDKMTGRDYYIQKGYDELPETVRIEMRRVFDTGVNNSGVWVRYKEVENLAGVMAYEYTHRPINTNSDRIRAMSDEELAEYLNNVETIGGHLPAWGRSAWLDWLKSEAKEENDGRTNQ